MKKPKGRKVLSGRNEGFTFIMAYLRNLFYLPKCAVGSSMGKSGVYVASQEKMHAYKGAEHIRYAKSRSWMRNDQEKGHQQRKQFRDEA